MLSTYGTVCQNLSRSWESKSKHHCVTIMFIHIHTQAHFMRGDEYFGKDWQSSKELQTPVRAGALTLNCSHDRDRWIHLKFWASISQRQTIRLIPFSARSVSPDTSFKPSHLWGVGLFNVCTVYTTFTRHLSVRECTQKYLYLKWYFSAKYLRDWEYKIKTGRWNMPIYYHFLNQDK